MKTGSVPDSAYTYKETVYVVEGVTVIVVDCKPELADTQTNLVEFAPENFCALDIVRVAPPPPALLITVVSELGFGSIFITQRPFTVPPLVGVDAYAGIVTFEFAAEAQ